MLIFVLSLFIFYSDPLDDPVALEPGTANVDTFLEADNPGRALWNADCDSFGSVCIKNPR